MRPSEIATYLNSLTPADVQGGVFGPDDMRAILAGLGSIAAQVEGADSELSESIDQAHDSVSDSAWPDFSNTCHHCNSTGQGRFECQRCGRCN